MLVCAALFSFLQPPSRASQKPTIRISNCPLIVIIVIVVLPVLVAIRFVVISSVNVFTVDDISGARFSPRDEVY